MYIQPGSEKAIYDPSAVVVYDGKRESQRIEFPKESDDVTTPGSVEVVKEPSEKPKFLSDAENKYALVEDEDYLDVWETLDEVRAKEKAKKAFFERNKKTMFQVAELHNKAQIWVKKMDRFFERFFYDKEDDLYKLRDLSERDDVFVKIEMALKKLQAGKTEIEDNLNTLEYQTQIKDLERNTKNTPDDAKIQEGDTLELENILYYKFVKKHLLPLYDDLKKVVNELRYIPLAETTYFELKRLVKSEVD
jgi:hypothetical protein